VLHEVLLVGLHSCETFRVVSILETLEPLQFEDFLLRRIEVNEPEIKQAANMLH
jgi:hypothetical protein